MAVREERGIDLLRHLQGVAAIDEDGGLLSQHDGEAGRAGEAGDPGKALGPRGHILALVFVGPRHDEASEAAARQLGA
jgi:hypothetical protein